MHVPAGQGSTVRPHHGSDSRWRAQLDAPVEQQHRPPCPGGRDRTCDLRINSPLLFRLSYTGSSDCSAAWTGSTLDDGAIGAAPFKPPGYWSRKTVLGWQLT